MKKLLPLALLPLLAVSHSFINQQSKTNVSAIENESIAIDYASDKWFDYGTNKLWSVDEENNQFTFYNSESEALEDLSKQNLFTSNLYLTKQFAGDNSTRGATVEMEATFYPSTTTEMIINNTYPSKSEGSVHIGLVPWYMDFQNWVLCYVNFQYDGEDETKSGRIFDIQTYVKINGTTYVEHYAKDYNNKWHTPDPSYESERVEEWHSAWPDRDNEDMQPTSLQGCNLDAADALTFYVKKTRKTYAGKECDAFTLKVNDYELNFGLDNYMFTGMKNQEDKYPEFNPYLGFYLKNSRKTIIKDFSVSISHEEVLPLPTISPIGIITKSGSVNKSIKVPEFLAQDNFGNNINYTVTVYDPDGEEVYLDGDNSFVPTKVGKYLVDAIAIDSLGYTGDYSYTIKITEEISHIDTDKYNDSLSSLNNNPSIVVAYVIFISIPVLIAVFIGLKIFFAVRKKRKK